MDLFVQNVINGLTIGAFYALVALGYTMVYGVLKLINFAHGDLFMWAPTWLGWAERGGAARPAAEPWPWCR